MHESKKVDEPDNNKFTDDGVYVSFVATALVFMWYAYEVFSSWLSEHLLRLSSLLLCSVGLIYAPCVISWLTSDSLTPFCDQRASLSGTLRIDFVFAG